MIHSPPASFVPIPIVVQRPPPEGLSAPVRATIWSLTAAVALGLHVGIYLALARPDAAKPVPPRPESLAAIMVNLAPVPEAARSEVDNASEGPPATASDAAAPEPPPPPPPPPPTEAVVTSPPAPPDVRSEAVLPAAPPKPKTPPPQKPPEKLLKAHKPRTEPEKPRKPKVTEERSTLHGGGPRSERQTANRTAAPSAGDMVSDATKAQWQSEVRGRIVRAKRFPSDAHGATGVAVVIVTFTAGGGVTGVRLIASSGNTALDGEAVSVMSRAAPYPPPPGGRATTLTVPLNFRR